MQPSRLALVAWLALAGLAPARAQDVPIQKDVVYGKAGGEELKLDLARPGKGDGPFPLVVCLHGGAWQLGGEWANTCRRSGPACGSQGLSRPCVVTMQPCRTLPTTCSGRPSLPFYLTSPRSRRKFKISLSNGLWFVVKI